MPPRHEKAARYLQSGIFDGVRSFASLEKRIAGFPEGDRGPAFEVFAEAYLVTQKTQIAKEVWPGNTVPHRLESKLRLAGAVGVDGVFETLTGQVCGYQVKFRSGRPTLTFAEISPFLGITDRVDRRVLFTNCDSISGLTEKRIGFYAIRGQDLDELEPRDFKAISAFIRHAAIRPEKFSPRPYQDAAVKDIIDGLKKHDRATAIMACGTGKTLVTLWVAERMGCKKILVLVPSLALLDQTLKEWLRHTSWRNPAFISVCSDPTVEKGIDELVIREADLKYKVDTDPKQVRRFLESEYKGVKLVFSTYQSSHIVGRAVSKKNPFDLGIFDEAHKTAGREGARYAFALEEKRLPIRKRLFVTATPRHYDVRKRDKEGDAKLVYSMDVPELYGPRVHTLTFADAARKGIICDYRVVISVVTSGMVNAELLRRGEVIVKGDVVKAQQVANQIALKEAVEETSSSKVLTFHARVNSAASFAGSGGEGITNHLKGFGTYHVSGDMPASERRKFLKAFESDHKAVMSNARCLTEGIDIPAIDMVAFLSPKKSRVDIVQAVGRALRKSNRGKKTHGHILIPLFLQQKKKETVEDAVDRGNFGEVWNVLNAMKEQDNELAEIIARMREERGRTKGFDDSRFREKVVCLGPKLSLDILRKSIISKCLDVIGNTWDERYGELKAFKDKNGHCLVPARWPENPQLGTWVEVQRRNKECYPPDRRTLLDKIGFVWDPREAEWEEMFAALKRYKELNSDCNVPQRWSQNRKLATWVSTQRSRKDRLTPDRKRQLENIGFDWNPFDRYWEEMFQALVTYKKEHGDCNVPDRWTENRSLGMWVVNQRSIRERLTPDRIQRLNDLGFIWDMRDAAWEEMFDALVEYKKKTGNCTPPRDWPENPGLGRWVTKQRTKKARLSPDKTRRLNDLGFIWETKEAAWEEMFEALVEYKKKTGNCTPPRDWPENPGLGRWVHNQRSIRGRIRPHRIQRLNDLGFVWRPHEESWEMMFEELAEYKKQAGNCTPPRNWPENPELGRWVIKQRTKKNQLSSDQVQRLNNLGFVWKPAEVFWEEMYQALAKYKKKTGNCTPPRGWPENTSLGNWVINQRAVKDRLKPDRVRKLDALGFVWDTRKAVWEEMYKALVEYKKKAGNCIVPQKWPENQKLGTWVSRQRTMKDRLAPDRIKRLNKLGFNWGERKDKSSPRN